MAENKDPVSGNEVPKGALPEEVRDDVPAMLSEGEFVIPADVVRYIGLDKLRKMRDQAKKGLEDMDAEGQIGGEPVSEESTVAFAEGGSVRNINSTRNVRSTRGLQTPSTSYEMKLYTNEAGNTLYVPVINGQATIAIPEGYTESSRSENINTSAEVIANGEKTEGDQTSAAIGCPEGTRYDPVTNACVPVSTGGESEQQPESNMTKLDLVASIAETLGDEEIIELVGDAKWQSIKDGLTTVAKVITSPVATIGSMLKGDKEQSKSDKMVEEAVSKIGAAMGDENIAKTLDEALNGFDGDGSREATGSAQITRSGMNSVNAELDAKVVQAMIGAGYTPAEANKMAAQAKIGLLNSPAAKAGTLQEHMTVPTDPNFVQELFMTDKEKAKAKAAKDRTITTATEDVKKQKDRVEKAEADRAARIADEDAAMAVVGSSGSGGGSLVTGRPSDSPAPSWNPSTDVFDPNDFTSNYDSGPSGSTPTVSSSHSPSSNTGGFGSGYSGGYSSPSSSSSSSPSSSSSSYGGNVSRGYTSGYGGWAEGGLVTKKAKKNKPKKKVAITKK